MDTTLENTITVNGVQLYYELHGPQDAPAVAILHGGPGVGDCRDQVRDYGPLADTKPVDMASTRALRTTVATDQGPLAVYVAHLGSARVNPRAGFWTDSRDRSAQALGKAIAAERNERVVLLGDLNGTTDDRAFAGITSQLRSAHDAAGDGFGFSWPAKFPVVRIDQILVRGVEPESSWSLPATGSDHLPVAAGISW